VEAPGISKPSRCFYDPSRITYTQLLDVFWRHIDPTDPGGQFVDRGGQYRSAIFYADEQQRRMAQRIEGSSWMASGQFDKPVVTDILPLGPFYEAEEYHQDYYRKNPIRYRGYRSGSGRDQFLQKRMGDGQVPPETGNRGRAEPSPPSPAFRHPDGDPR
jgi:peptide methionine sulfoxide reductase msrA/msrB